MSSPTLEPTTTTSTARLQSSLSELDPLPSSSPSTTAFSWDGATAITGAGELESTPPSSAAVRDGGSGRAQHGELDSGADSGVQVLQGDRAYEGIPRDLRDLLVSVLFF
ncbi:hypothetical protein LINPERPRIM_LOCUS1742 [Linum perenne]